jgi:DNA invertase Pin-like site-specific DNA recombinase
MLIGYARCSTADQHVEMQLDALRAVGCERIFTDTISGAKDKRPGLDEALAFARAGDVLTVWRLTRLGRSLRHLITLAEELERRGIELRSLHESIDTTTATGRLIFHVLASLAEFERDLTLEQIAMGRAAARARGRLGGRPRGLSPDQETAVAALVDADDMSVAAIARMFACSRATIHRVYQRRTRRSPSHPDGTHGNGLPRSSNEATA